MPDHPRSEGSRAAFAAAGRVVVLALLGGLSLAWPVATSAQTSAPDATQVTRDTEARQLFEAARSAFDDARYEVALARFREAHELSQRPELLYNIGQCLDRLRRDDEAIPIFEQYLAAAPTAANRHEVEERLAILRAARGTLAPDTVPAPEVTETPAVAAPAPAESASIEFLGDAPPAQRETPIYEEWWLWTIVGALVIAAVAIPIGVFATSGSGTSVDDPIRGDVGIGGVVITLVGP